MNRLLSLQKQIGSPSPQPAFKYTSNEGCLTYQQRKFFEINGFLVVPRFKTMDNQHLKAKNGNILSRVCDSIKKEQTLEKEIETSFEKVGALQKEIQKHQLQLQKLQNKLLCPELIPYLQNFCKENKHTFYQVYTPKSQTFAILEKTSSKQPYQPKGPIKVSSVVLGMFASEDSTQLSEVLYVYPGSHKRQEDCKGTQEKSDWQDLEDRYYQLNAQVRLQMKKGDLVFLHSNLEYIIEDKRPEYFKRQIFCQLQLREFSSAPLEEEKGKKKEELGCDRISTEKSKKQNNGKMPAKVKQTKKGSILIHQVCFSNKIKIS